MYEGLLHDVLYTLAEAVLGRLTYLPQDLGRRTHRMHKIRRLAKQYGHDVAVAPLQRLR
jgi:hypothetical protein